MPVLHLPDSYQSERGGNGGAAAGSLGPSSRGTTTRALRHGAGDDDPSASLLGECAAGPDGENAVAPGTSPGPSPAKKRRVLGICSLVAIMYSTVSGGPIGSETVISIAGPLPGLIGLVAFPIFYTMPLALVTAELCTLYPDNGGFVVWTRAAFGPFWSLQMGCWQWLAGVVDNAAYPVLALDTLKLMVPALATLDPFYRWLIKAAFACALVLLALSGVRTIGPAITIFNLLSIVPFLVLAAVAFPKADPAIWLERRESVDLAGVSNLFAILFWNYNGVHQVREGVRGGGRGPGRRHTCMQTERERERGWRHGGIGIWLIHVVVQYTHAYPTS